MMDQDTIARKKRGQPVSTKTAVFVILFVALPGLAGAQPPGGWVVDRTHWGDPDLQAVWDYRTLTPVERPEELGDKAVLTDEEVAELEAEAVRNNVDRVPPPGSVGGYNRFWLDFGTNVIAGGRTSLIIDPPDGRLPPRRLGVVEQEASFQEDVPEARPIRYRSGGAGTDGPEDRGLSERCIVGNNAGPPMLPDAYNNNVQIFQTRDHVVLFNEMINDARIVPLDGRPHLPEHIRQWMGDSRARWEGDTLVVETRNFVNDVAYGSNIRTAYGSGDAFHLTERFRRDAEDLLHYEYTVDDPLTFTRPFTVALPMRKLDGVIFEYACHEGNYGIYNQLSGARAEDREAAGSR